MTTGLNHQKLENVFPHYQGAPSNSILDIAGKICTGKLSFNDAWEELDVTAFKLYRSIITPSNTLTLAAAGGAIGHFTGLNSVALAATGGVLGALCDYGPKIADQAPNDLKELAKDVSNIGLFALGTFAAYQCIPDSWIQAAITYMPKALQEIPQNLTLFANDSSIPPHSLDGISQQIIVKPALLLGKAVYDVSKTTAKLLGFPNFEKFMGAAVMSNFGIDGLKLLGKTPLIKPFGDLAEEYSGKRPEFFANVASLTAAVGAVLYAAHKFSGSALTAPPHLTSLLNGISNGIGAAVLSLSLLPLHMGYNYAYPPEENLETLQQELKVTTDALAKKIKDSTSALNTLVLNAFKDEEIQKRRDILKEIDKVIVGLTNKLTKRNTEGYLPDTRMKLLINASILEALNLKATHTDNFHLRLERLIGKKTYPTSNEHNEVKAIMLGGDYDSKSQKVTIDPNLSALSRMQTLLNEQKQFVTDAIAEITAQQSKAYIKYTFDSVLQDLNKLNTDVDKALTAHAAEVDKWNKI